MWNLFGGLFYTCFIFMYNTSIFRVPVCREIHRLYHIIIIKWKKRRRLMQDKRIKQINTEMFIAWGVICATCLVLNSHWWHLGIVATITCVNPQMSCIGSIIFLFVKISNLPAELLSYCICKFLMLAKLSSPIPAIIGYTIFYIIQISFYWYLGNLTGRFIVWIKQKFKSLRHQKQLQSAQRHES